MKRRVVWLLALLGVLWLFRRAVGRPEPVHVAPTDDGVGDRPASGEASVGDDPAEELRRKLGEARDRTEPAAADDGIEERRTTLHEQARATADEMRRSASD